MLHLDVLCSSELRPYLPKQKDDSIKEKKSEDVRTLSDVELVDLIMKMCDKMVRVVSIHLLLQSALFFKEIRQTQHRCRTTDTN